MRKTKTIDAKAENGMIVGYASTWTREPDSYGDVVAKGAFAEYIEQLKAEGRVLPFLLNHDSYNINAFIGTVVELEEDDHGLKFVATFDDTKEAQRARELAMDGRLCKFSFSYDVLEAAEVTLEDGRKANELRKLIIHEVSLVMYPANSDTSVISVKSGRRNSKSDEDIIKQIIDLAQSLLADAEEVDDTGEPEAAEDEPKANADADAKELEANNARKNALLEYINTIK